MVENVRVCVFVVMCKSVCIDQTSQMLYIYI